MDTKRFIPITIVAFLILVLSNATLSLATTIDEKKSELSEIKQKIDSLNEKVAEVVDEYNKAANDFGRVKVKLRKNEAKLTKIKQELKLRQKSLSERVVNIYKSGPYPVVSLIIQTSSFRDLVSNMYLANRIISNDKFLIEDVKETKGDFEKIKNNLKAEKDKKEVLANKVASNKVKIQKMVNEKEEALQSVKKDLARLQAEERERIRRIREEALRKLREQKELRNPQQQNQSGDQPTIDININYSGSSVIEIAKKYLGVRYQWGGSSPESGFDCSGFASFVYRQVGVFIPRTSREQYNYLATKGRLVSEANLQPGDLVFYGRSYVNDVKLYMGEGYIIGANGGQFIPGEVKILPLHYRSDFYAAGRP